MNQTFSVNGFTITVRARIGLDNLDEAIIHSQLINHVSKGKGIQALSEREWWRIRRYTTFLQQSTAEIDVPFLPNIDSPESELGKGFDAWIAALGEHTDLYDQWEKAYLSVDKATPDPQAKSGGKKSTGE